ncbi:restriction endonuclease subunit S [Vibrio sp. ZSDZ65]|uniref:Restriction endonuclease subunit S n=1 Tax=Vibrio qingdaonensis TaxID=2829491 RepID=A0A9X3CM67_9VIBR|nr:restriction endonuclease subunit S [Vibrio qingdaonensis]MCW8346019.1 restriction endonuclease subunit S [Vibrio qingdaonensis]
MTSSKVRLGDIAEIVMGQSPKGDTCNNDGSGMPLLNGPTEFGTTHPYPTQFTTDAKKTSLVGDILFCVRGSTTGRMNYGEQEYAIGRGIGAIRGKGGYSTPFVKSVIESNLAGLLKVATGTTFPNLGKDALNNFEVEIIDHNAAKFVGKFAEQLEGKIANNKVMNQTLEKIAQRIFKSWFIDFDPVKANKEGLPFDGLSPEIQALFPSEFESSELGMIPKGWKAGCLGDFTSVQGGYAFKSKSFIEQGNPVVKIKNIVGDGTIRLNDCQCVDDDLASSSLRFKLNNGDILMAMTGATVGKSGLYVGDGRNAYLNQRVARFKSSLEVDDNYFTYLNLQHPVVFNTIVKTAHGSAQPNISAKGIEQTPVIVPSLNAISKFEDIALKLFERVISNNAQNITLSKLRDRLLPKLISGQLSVGEAKEELAEAM